MSLSGQYLEELSRRYKRQVDDMQKSLNRTLQVRFRQFLFKNIINQCHLRNLFSRLDFERHVAANEHARRALSSRT